MTIPNTTPTQRVEQLRTTFQNQNWGYRDMYLLALQLATELEEARLKAADRDEWQQVAMKVSADRDRLLTELEQSRKDKERRDP